MDQQFQLIHRNNGMYITLPNVAWVVNRVNLDDQGWFPKCDKSFFHSSKYPDQFWCPTGLIFSGNGARSLGIKAVGTWS